MIDIYNIIFRKFRKKFKIKLKFPWNDLIIFKKIVVICIKEVFIYYIC